MVERGVDAEGPGAVPQHEVVPVQLALRQFPRLDHLPHPLVRGGDALRRVVPGVDQAALPPLLEAGLDGRFEGREGEVDVDGAAAAERLAAADDDAVVSGGRAIAMEHEAGIAAGVHGAPHHERPLLDEDDALTRPPQLVRHGGSAGPAAHDQVVDGAVGVDNALARGVIAQPAGGNRGSVALGVDGGLLHEDHRALDARQGHGHGQIPDPAQVHLAQLHRHLGRRGTARGLEQKREQRNALIRRHAAVAAGAREQALDRGLAGLPQAIVEGQGGGGGQAGEQGGHAGGLTEGREHGRADLCCDGRDVGLDGRGDRQGLEGKPGVEQGCMGLRDRRIDRGWRRRGDGHAYLLRWFGWPSTPSGHASGVKPERGAGGAPWLACCAAPRLSPLTVGREQLRRTP
jgi:hypothetical protein